MAEPTIIYNPLHCLNPPTIIGEGRDSYIQRGKRRKCQSRGEKVNRISGNGTQMDKWCLKTYEAEHVAQEK